MPVAADVNVFTFWVGCQPGSEQSGSGPWDPLLQPELWYWGNTTPWWSAQSQVATSGASGGFFTVGVPGTISEGDLIEGKVFVYAPDTGQGATWEIFTKDWNTGNAAIALWTVGSSNPAMTQAILGVIEVQGLKKCDGLPTYGSGTGGEEFIVGTLAQEAAGSGGWDTYVDVIGLASTGVTTTPEFPGGPNCNYEASVSTAGGYLYDILSWSN
jgi:hypothetical protein